MVVARSPQNPKHVICKRVLGLEGDTVHVPPSSRHGPSRTVKVRVLQEAANFSLEQPLRCLHEGCDAFKGSLGKVHHMLKF